MDLRVSNPELSNIASMGGKFLSIINGMVVGSYFKWLLYHRDEILLMVREENSPFSIISPPPTPLHTSHTSLEAKSNWVLFSVKCNQIVSLLTFNATLLAFADTMKKQLTSVEVIPDSMWISSCCILIGQLLCSEGVYTLAKGRRMSQFLLLGVPTLSAVQGTGC